MYYKNPEKILRECEVEIRRQEALIGKYGEKWDNMYRKDIERIRGIMVVANKDIEERDR